MSHPFLDSLAVYVGALNAHRAALSFAGCQQTNSVGPGFQFDAWQQHAMTVASALATVMYALAGGSREALVANALIVAAGAFVPLLCASIQGDAS